MKMSYSNLIGDINNIIFEWQKSGLVSGSRLHQAFAKSNNITEVTWGNDGYVLKGEKFTSIAEYCSLIENRQYSMLLNDGSIFQFYYSLRRDKIIKHRLCWYPAPIDINPEDYFTESVVDLILEKMSLGDLDVFRARSPIRFDYNQDDARDGHPAVHMHISDEDCRIPVKTPLCLRKFMTFIVENFYPDLNGASKLYKNLRTWEGLDALSAYDRSRFHLNIVNER